MNIAPSHWAETLERLRRRRNSRVQIGLGLASLAIAVGGFIVLSSLTDHFELYIRPRIPRGWRGTFDYWNGVFLIAWSVTFHGLRVHDGRHYWLRWRGARLPRSRPTDVAILIAFAVVAIAWGELVHAVLARRAQSSAYLDRLPPGTSAHILQHGTMAVVTAYVVIVAAVYFIGVIAARFTPADMSAATPGLPS
jgi:hypothetical protein